MSSPSQPTAPTTKPPDGPKNEPGEKPGQPSHTAGSGSTTGDPRPQGDRSSQGKKPV